MKTRLHLAYHILDRSDSGALYGTLLGCGEDRSTNTWIDFEFFGHQISLHPSEPFSVPRTGVIDNDMVSLLHYGLVMSMANWKDLVEQLTSRQIDFVVPLSISAVEEPGEQAMMFFRNAGGHLIQVKGFTSLNKIYIQ